MYLLVDSLVLRIMIRYHIMIPLLLFSLLIITTSDFCQYYMHDTSYNTHIMTSPILEIREERIRLSQRSPAQPVRGTIACYTLDRKIKERADTSK
jgi:hypothetical protein